MQDFQHPIFAFIDESGNSDLNTEQEGTSESFILVAVLIKEKDLSYCNSKLESIRSDCFPDAKEIKSKYLKGKRGHKKRLKILNEIKDLPFYYCALIVKKSLVYIDSGLRFRQSFHKFFDRELCNTIISNNREVSIRSDEIGSIKYMNSFKNYLEENLEFTLFPYWNHEFVNSVETPGVQLADLIAGTLGKYYDNSRNSHHGKEYMELLIDKQLSIDFFPRSHYFNSIPLSEYLENEDVLGYINTERAITFIRNNIESEETTKRQRAFVLKILLNSTEIKHKKRFYSAELMSLLEEAGIPVKSKRFFTTKIISPIRDAEIIISGNSKGYKLAVNKVDVFHYLTHNKNIIEPMISRIKSAQTSFRTETMGAVDILDLPDFEGLKFIVQAFGDRPRIVRLGEPPKTNNDEKTA